MRTRIGFCLRLGMGASRDLLLVHPGVVENDSPGTLWSP